MHAYKLGYVFGFRVKGLGFRAFASYYEHLSWTPHPVIVVKWEYKRTLM